MENQKNEFSIIRLINEAQEYNRKGQKELRTKSLDEAEKFFALKI